MIVKCEELDILKPLIKRAGQAVLKYYGHAGEVQYKEQNDSPVTRADLASQEIIIGGLAQFGYPVLSEEKTDDMARLQSRRVWIIDPLDGTKDFLQNTSEFSIMIGLVEDGRPILGTVYQPASDILYYAKRGTGAYREQGDGLPMRLKVSDETKFQSVRLLVSRHHLLPAEIEVAKQL
ncbi:MAG: Inositol monophosphatase, partial [Parcubacteria group bacterium GW2011_GWC2_45_7]